MDVICCNCDFVYEPTVLRLQLKSDPAESGSGRILGVGYPNRYLPDNQYPSIANWYTCTLYTECAEKLDRVHKFITRVCDDTESRSITIKYSLHQSSITILHQKYWITSHQSRPLGLFNLPAKSDISKCILPYILAYKPIIFGWILTIKFSGSAYTRDSLYASI